MDCCKSSIPVYVPLTFSDKWLFGYRCTVKKMVAALKNLITPEPTDLPQLPPDPSEKRIWGAIKTLVWIAASIGIGSVLVTICR